MTNKKYITFDEAKEILGVKAAQVYNIFRGANKVKKFKDRMGHVRYLESEIRAIADERAKFTKEAEWKRRHLKLRILKM